MTQARPVTLEDFDAPTGAEPSPAPLTEEARLAAYEEGYKAGWEDAAAAEQTAQAHISADFAQNLRDLSFTFAEARSQVIRDIGPLLTLMAEKMLPRMAQEGFARCVIEQVEQAAEQASDRPVTIMVNPANADAIEHLLEAIEPPLNARIDTDATLGPGQAFVQGHRGDTAIDLDGVEARIRAAVSDFLTHDQEVAAHG